MKRRIIIGAVCFLLSVTALVAKPVLERINAYLNSSINYTLNGETILENQNTLVYKDEVYVPVRDLAEALGYLVTYTDYQVDLIKPMPLENITIEKARIIEVLPETKQVVILPDGKKDQLENYIVLNVDETQTSISHENDDKGYLFKNLAPNMEVKVVHSPIMTASIPPQTPALSIQILGEAPEVIITETPE